MCQAKQIWSNAAQHSQRFETVLCKPTRAKQAYTWRPCPWHIRYFRYGFYNPRSKFPRHFFQRCWWSHEQWSLPLSNFIWQATQMEHTTYRTTLPISQNKWSDLQHNTLKDSLANIDTNISTRDELEELAVTNFVTNSWRHSTHKVYSRNDPQISY